MKQAGSACFKLHAGFLFGLISIPENGGDMSEMPVDLHRTT
jgi:hypothetical protein